VTLDARISKLRLTRQYTNRPKDGVSDDIDILLNPVKGCVCSAPYGIDKEFSGHGQVNKDIDCESYLAKQYYSWERGKNENASGLLRQYFPKTMSLADIAYNNFKISVDKLNPKPKRYFGFKTPYRVLMLVNCRWCVYESN